MQQYTYDSKGQRSAAVGTVVQYPRAPVGGRYFRNKKKRFTTHPPPTTHHPPTDLPSTAVQQCSSTPDRRAAADSLVTMLSGWAGFAIVYYSPPRRGASEPSPGGRFPRSPLAEVGHRGWDVAAPRGRGRPSGARESQLSGGVPRWRKFYIVAVRKKEEAGSDEEKAGGGNRAVPGRAISTLRPR